MRLSDLVVASVLVVRGDLRRCRVLRRVALLQRCFEMNIQLACVAVKLDCFYGISCFEMRLTLLPRNLLAPVEHDLGFPSRLLACSAAKRRWAIIVPAWLK